MALRRNAPAEVIESLLDFHPVAITTNAPDGREPMRMALDYADRDDETAVVAVLNRTLREVGGVSHVHAVEEVAVEEVAVDPPLVGDGANRDDTEEKVDGSVEGRRRVTGSSRVPNAALEQVPAGEFRLCHA